MLEPDDVLPLAISAGAEILAIYAGDFDVALKADSSPVTQADLRAEAIILAGLSRLAPAIPVIAEEAVSRGQVPDTPGQFFLVDPLDGSREFIARNGEFTVNIALIDNARPSWGIVYAPVQGALWWGHCGKGAYRGQVMDNVIVEAHEIHVAPIPSGQPRVVGSRSHPDPQVMAYCENLGVSGFLEAGSSLKFCLLAQGDADLYPRFNRTMEWDTAAGDAVLRAAGGAVRTEEGFPLTYGKRGRPGELDFVNPSFVASTVPLS